MAFLFHSMSSQVFWPGSNPTVLTAYFGGKTANHELLHLTDAEMTQEILRQMSVIFQKSLSELQQLLLKSDVRRWDNDPFAKMAYSYCPVGTAKFRAALASSCGPQKQLLFAGEATHPTKASFAHGALEEGERAADEILERFSRWNSETCEDERQKEVKIFGFLDWKNTRVLEKRKHAKLWILHIDVFSTLNESTTSSIFFGTNLPNLQASVGLFDAKPCHKNVPQKVKGNITFGKQTIKFSDFMVVFQACT